MTDTEKMMLRALKAIALEARKGRPNPDRIYQIAVDAVSRATAPLIDRKADK